MARTKTRLVGNEVYNYEVSASPPMIGLEVYVVAWKDGVIDRIYFDYKKAKRRARTILGDVACYNIHDDASQIALYKLGGI